MDGVIGIFNNIYFKIFKILNKNIINIYLVNLIFYFINSLYKEIKQIINNNMFFI